VRLKHAQISWITNVSARFIHFWCPLGKRRSKGKQIPFAWVVPRVLSPGTDIAPTLTALYKRLGGDRTVRFLIPDVAVGAWAEIQPDTPWRDRAMPYAKVVALVQGFSCALNVDKAWAAEFTTYTIRRFGPTCAGALGFDDNQMQALSNWQEVPQNDARPSGRARFLSSRHYDDSTNELSGDLKGLLAVALYGAFSDNPGVVICKEQVIEEFKILRQLRGQGGQQRLEDRWFHSDWEVAISMPDAPILKPAVSSVALMVVAKATPPAIEESSSSDSDSLSVDSEASSSDEQSTTCAALQMWFVQTSQGPTHFAAETDAQGMHVPICRNNIKTPFSRRPVLQGSFLDLPLLAGHTSGACTSCLSVLDQDMFDAWMLWGKGSSVPLSLPIANAENG